MSCILQVLQLAFNYSLFQALKIMKSRNLLNLVSFPSSPAICISHGPLRCLQKSHPHGYEDRFSFSILTPKYLLYNIDNCLLFWAESTTININSC